MKITSIGPLPPIKAISPYFVHFSRDLAKKADLEVFTYKKIKPESSYSGGTTEQNLLFKGIKNADVKYLLSWYNPLSWIYCCLKAKGKIVHIQHWALYSSIIYCFIVPFIKLQKKKIVITVHNITPHIDNILFVISDKIVNKIIFPFADWFIVHNPRNKKKLIDLYNISEDKISVITHGILKPENTRNISKKEARKKLNLPMDKKIILFFGYIWKYKGLDTILKSLDLIRREIPDVLLLIAGQPVKYFDSLERYEQIIKEYDLHKHVVSRFEYIPDSEVELYFNTADIVVLPYREPFDTHGGVAALALSFKKPMVVTDVGGLPEYVKDQRVVSNPDDILNLSKNIINVLKNEKLIDKLTKDSEDLLKELTWDKIADKTIDIYNCLSIEKS